jgi:hypothetical protein
VDLRPAMVLWMLVGLVALHAFRRGAKRKQWVRATVWAIVMVPFLSLGLSAAYHLCMAHSRTWVYARTFGVRPEPDIRITRKAVVLATEYSCFYMELAVNEGQLQRVLHGQFSKIDRIQFEAEMAGDSTNPEWFNPMEGSHLAFYLAQPSGEPDSLRIRVSYDIDRQVAYCSASRIY